MSHSAPAAGTYLVVGASGTIGSAVARKLATPGAVIGLHYCNNRSAAENLRSALENVGARAICIQSPLDSEDACYRMSEQAYTAMGIPHGIALCGGKVPWKAWQDLSPPDWQSVLFEHCVAPFTLAKLAVSKMAERGDGCVAFLSSIAAKYGGSPRSLHYAAAKGALETAMHGLSRDVAKAGVRINGVRAGFVDSPQHRAGRSEQEITERIGKIPMGRSGRPEEIAAAIAFLLSVESGFMTGEIVTVAGGD